MENPTLQVDRASEKNFGIVFAVVFALLSFYLSWTNEFLIWWPLSISAILLLVSFIQPQLLKWPNLWWFKLGMLLGAVIAPIVMGLVYITTLVPIGIFIRLSGKDLLHIKFDSQAKSYWIQRESPMQSMKKQF